MDRSDKDQHRLSSVVDLEEWSPVDTHEQQSGNCIFDGDIAGSGTAAVLPCSPPSMQRGDVCMESSVHSHDDDDISDVQWEMSPDDDADIKAAAGTEASIIAIPVSPINDCIDIDIHNRRWSPDKASIHSADFSTQLLRSSPPINPPSPPSNHHHHPPPSLQPSGGFDVSPDIIDRALSTASSMADWAGWAVRQALKNHSSSSSTIHVPSKEAAASQGGHGMDRISAAAGRVMVNDWNGVHIAGDVGTGDDPSVSVQLSNTSSSMDSDIHDTPLSPVVDIHTKIGLEDRLQKTTDVVISPRRRDLKLDAYISRDAYIHQQQKQLEVDSRHQQSLPSPPAPTPSPVACSPPPLSYQALFDGEVQEEVRARKQYASAMRDTETMTQEMREQVIGLLQAFSIPYMVAPYEAEAQCAVLEQVGRVR